MPVGFRLKGLDTVFGVKKRFPFFIVIIRKNGRKLEVFMHVSNKDNVIDAYVFPLIK